MSTERLLTFYIKIHCKQIDRESRCTRKHIVDTNLIPKETNHKQTVHWEVVVTGKFNNRSDSDLVSVRPYPDTSWIPDTLPGTTPQITWRLYSPFSTSCPPSCTPGPGLSVPRSVTKFLPSWFGVYKRVSPYPGEGLGVGGGVVYMSA